MVQPNNFYIQQTSGEGEEGDDRIQNEKTDNDDTEKTHRVEDIEDAVRNGRNITPAMRQKVAQHYSGKATDDNVATSADIGSILDRIIVMTDEEATDILVETIAFHTASLFLPCDLYLLD